MTAWILLIVATVPALWALGAISATKAPVTRRTLLATGVALGHSAATALVLAVDGWPLGVAIGMGVGLIVAELLPVWLLSQTRPRTEI